METLGRTTVSRIYRLIKNFLIGEWPFLIIVICIGIAYSNTLHVPFIFDDRSSIEENASIRSWKTVLFPPGNSGLTVSGRPFVNASIALNYAIHGVNVAGYHIFNICIHILSSLVLFGLVRKTLELPSMARQGALSPKAGACIFALLWGLHPLQTESVTYMIQRAEAIVGLFYLLTLYAFARSATGDRQRGWQAISVICCMCGMASKEVMASAPIMVFIYDYAFLTGGIKEAWSRRKWYFLGLISSWIILALCIYSTRNRGYTVGYDSAATWWTYLLTQSVAILHYIRLVFWPDVLILDYGQTLAYGYHDALWQFPVLCLIFIATVITLFLRPKIGFICLLFFAVLAPTSSIVPVLTQTIAEHRMYVAIAPVIAVIYFPVMYYMGRRRYVLVVLVIALISLSVKTLFRNYDYRSEESIWITVTKSCPYNNRGWACLAHVYAERGDMQLAKETARQALRYNSKNTDALCAYAEILKRMREYVESEEVFRYAYKFAPDSYNVNFDLGTLLLDVKRPAESIGLLRKAMEVDSRGIEAQHNLGKAYVALGQYDEAIVQFKAILKRKSNADNARNNLVNALDESGNHQEAARILEEGLRINNDSVELRRTLGVFFLKEGQYAKAKGEFQHVLRVRAEDAKAHANLGLVYSLEGDTAASSSHYCAALEQKDELSDDMCRGLRMSLAEEYAKNGKTNEALDQYKEVLKIERNSLEIRYFIANYMLRNSYVDDAIANYEIIVNENKENVNYNYELGVAYLMAGKVAEARTKFEKVLSLQPQHVGASEYLKKIEGPR